VTVADLPSFGRLLRGYRVAAGLSQAELAERARLSTRAVSDLERGVHGAPQRQTMALLIDALDLSDAERAALEAAVVRRRGPPALQPAIDGSPADLPVGAALPLPLTPLIDRNAELAALVGDGHALAQSLEGLADLALARSQPAQAATLLGAAGALRDHIGAPRAPARQVRVARIEAAIGRALGAAAAEALALESEPAPAGHEAPPPARTDGAAAYRCPYPFPSRESLFGRDAELLRLGAVLDRGRAAGQLVLIGAPAGTGKSALLGALMREAEARGFLCLAGAAHEQEGVVSFGPFQEALAGYLLGLPREQARAAVGASGSDLALVVPELRDPLGVEASAAGDRPGQQRVFAAVHAFLRRLAQTGPVVLCLEDLHAADAASLQLFGYLARQLAHPNQHVPLVMIGSYRDDEVRPGQPLARLLAVLGRERHIEMIKLPSLERAAAAALVGAVLGDPASESLSEWLYTSTEGNALFLEQLALALHEEKQLVRRAGRWYAREDQPRAIPAVVRELIGQRVERLGDRCRAMLAAAAVLGQSVEPEVLLAISDDGDAGTAFADLAEAIDAQLLHEARGCYVFAHALVREAIHAGLGKARRMRLHTRAGKVLERRGGAGAAELAHHFAEAVPTRPMLARALRYSLAAGAGAAGSWSYREAHAHFRRACELIERGSVRVKPSRRREALEGRGRAERELALWPESIATFRALLTLTDQPVGRASARGMIASVHIHIGEIEEALAESETGLAELAAQTGPEAVTARLYLQQQIALVWYLQGRYSQIVELGRRMLSEAVPIDQPRALVLAHAVTAWGYMGLGEVTASLDHNELALAAARRLGDKIHLAITHENLGSQNYRGGRFAAAGEHLDRALALYAEAASELRAVNSMQHRCRVWSAEGELERARAQASLALELGSEGQDRWAADGHQIIGSIQSLRGEWAAASASFEAALRIRRKVGDMAGTIESLVALGLVDQRLGHRARAREKYEEAAGIASAIDPGPSTVLARRHLGRLRLLQGDQVGAEAELCSALALAETIPEALEYAPTLLAMAELRCELDDLESALDFAERSLEHARPVEHRAEAHLLLASLRRRAGDRARASAHVVEATAQANRLQSPRLLSLAHLARAMVAAMGSSDEAAVASFEAALRDSEVIGASYEGTAVPPAHGARLAGDPARAETGDAELAKARSLLDQLGARLPGVVDRRQD
jgi:tetratricopeptide (TPR) repeat protein/transcriptional regulator with XRE-family HTH domain